LCSDVTHNLTLVSLLSGIEAVWQAEELEMSACLETTGTGKMCAFMANLRLLDGQGSHIEHVCIAI
jgi:hypothetical protein